MNKKDRSKKISKKEKDFIKKAVDSMDLYSMLEWASLFCRGENIYRWDKDEEEIFLKNLEKTYLQIKTHGCWAVFESLAAEVSDNDAGFGVTEKTVYNIYSMIKSLSVLVSE